MSKAHTQAQRSVAQLANEAVAAKALRDALATVTDDETAIRDTIEGETSLHETIERVMELIRNSEILISGIDRMQETLDARKKRLKDRLAYYRAAVEQAMVIGEITSLELADATVSVRRVSPALEIIEESKIPAAFWKPQDPTLDRPAVTKALKDGQDVPGATLGYGGITLSIRRA